MIGTAGGLQISRPQSIKALPSRPSCSNNRASSIVSRVVTADRWLTWTMTGECLDLELTSEPHSLWTHRQALLGEVDEMLVAQGSPEMTALERSIAVRKLMECTGTRGATFALGAARDLLLARRRVMQQAGKKEAPPQQQRQEQSAAVVTPPALKPCSHGQKGSGLDWSNEAYTDGDLDADW